ncbi:MAG TPA: discoidin domain-containing protein [Vicinamibacteria bacterium]|nr:discoidin domain-containing protein [Vicinamibacteria bacterium]
MERQKTRLPLPLSSGVIATAVLLSLGLVSGTLHAQAAAPAAGTGALVPIPIQLPKPMFEGTPQNLSVPNLQKPLGRPRDPFLAPAGVTNVAKGKKVTSSDSEPVIGELEQVTDGDKKGADGSFVELGPGLQWVQIDLGAPQEVYAILFWHFHKTPRVYFDVVVRLADDAGFTKNVRTLFDNDHDNTSGLGAGADMNYVETAEGKLVDAKGSKARYVRLYSRGNNANELNHYVEVEVFGRPAK